MKTKMRDSHDKDRTYVCCICGKTKIGYGNNPWPVNTDPKAKCCDNCNKFVVIPARMEGN